MHPGRIMEIIRDYNICSRKAENSSKVIPSKGSNNPEDEEDTKLEWTTGDKNTPNVQTILVDGSWKKNVKTNQWQAAVAWKNENKDPNEECATRIYANSPEQTEAYVILKAITDMEWRSAGIIIKSDNREVILALKDKRDANKNIENIIKDIRRIANSFLFVSCIKVRREEVTLAHNLAVKARKG